MDFKEKFFMRNTLICTVGTSLLESNLKHLSEKTQNKPNNWKEIKKYYEENNWNLLAKEILKIDPSIRICGAEINTINEARSKKWLDLQNLFLMVSDTQFGEDTGQVLKKYYKYRKDLNFKNIEVIKVKDLQDERPKDFKILGLRNLVREFGKIVKRIGIEQIAIDATGGYKAQIAIAVLIGQVLNIPVYYKHERFSEIIDFPPLPISLDYSLFGEYSDLFTFLENSKEVKNSDIENLDPKIRIFLEEETIGNIDYLALSPIGQIYIEGFRIRNPKPPNLKNSNNRKEPTFRDDHYPIGFKKFVYKVWEENKFIDTCKSLTYRKQKSIKNISFFVRHEENEKKLIGTYIDKNNFGGRFNIILSDTSDNSLIWAADILNQKNN